MGIQALALRLLVAAIALPALCPTAGAGAANPSALVTELGTQLRQVLADRSLTLAERQQRFRGLLDTSFDFPIISRFVLGRYWQASNAAFHQEFSGVFEDYVIQSLSGRFSEYSGESMNVTAARVESERSTIVSTTIMHPNGAPPAKVDWWVLNTPNGFKVADVSVSGISMALSYREQFAAVIDHDGGKTSTLISELREKLNETPNNSITGNTQANGGKP